MQDGKGSQAGGQAETGTRSGTCAWQASSRYAPHAGRHLQRGGRESRRAEDRQAGGACASTGGMHPSGGPGTAGGGIELEVLRTLAACRRSDRVLSGRGMPDGMRLGGIAALAPPPPPPPPRPPSPSRAGSGPHCRREHGHAGLDHGAGSSRAAAHCVKAPAAGGRRRAGGAPSIQGAAPDGSARRASQATGGITARLRRPLLPSPPPRPGGGRQITPPTQCPCS